MGNTEENALAEVMNEQKERTMVIGIRGENCSGKSTLANEIQRTIGAEVITGKDLLDMFMKKMMK